MHKNSGLLCDSNLAEGITFQTIFILLVMLLSGIALSLLLMFGEWFVHSMARKTNRNTTIDSNETSVGTLETVNDVTGVMID